MKYLNNIYEILDKYKLILCDLWGVVHDGSQLYPQVKDFLNYCQPQHSLIFVTNAPRRNKFVKEKLADFDIYHPQYIDVVSSGELFVQQLLAQKLNLKGNKYFLIAPSYEHKQMANIGLQKVDDVNEADFIICLGYYDSEILNQGLAAILQHSSKLNLEFYCLNPDMIVVKQAGTSSKCAGDIARQYETYGGRVQYFGKPFESIYQYAISLVDNKIAKSEILMIGDSLHTDIKGANNFGIDSCLITQGILSVDLKNNNIQTKLEELCNQHQAWPNYVIDSFINSSN